jgi:short-subunit dehydrogenase
MTAKQVHYAVVAGGSKGIGFAIAEALARRGYHLIIIGRNEASLSHAKNEIEKSYGIQVYTLVKDITDHDAADDIVRWCGSKNLSVNFLCNVAGIGGAKDYLDSSLESMRYMIHLNIESVIALTSCLLPLLELNSPSYILNVSSMAGFGPIPVKNIYSATKSAVIFFSYALRYQLKQKHISVSCLCPGPVFTNLKLKKIRKKNWVLLVR